MDDKRIEDMLRGSWQPEPPDGMRERIMNRARRELRRPLIRFPRLAVPRWQLGFAATALAVVVACNLVGAAQESRIAALVQSDGSAPQVMVARGAGTLSYTRAQINELLNDPSAELLLP